MGANDRVHVGIIGVGGRGCDHVNFCAANPNCAVAALCDVDEGCIKAGRALLVQKGLPAPGSYGDMRDLLAAPGIDAVFIATPDHWHALAAVWACQAGKDVYLEKPCGHNIHEGRKIVEAARKYNRIVQVGSQSRSAPIKIEAIELLAQRAIGKVYLAKGICFKRRKSVGHKEDSTTPPGVNWDKFLGPAPMRPFNELRFKYNWHWFWDTGNGDIANQGFHEMDIARWGLGRTLPSSVVSTGGKYAYNDDQETPNTQIATFDYGDAEIVFDVRGLLTGIEGGLLPDRIGNIVGNLFYGENGWMAVNQFGYQVYKGESREKIMDRKAERPDYSPEHIQNFLDAVRTRDRKDLRADIEVGTTSAVLAFLANISYRLGRRLAFDPQKMEFPGDAEANAMLHGSYRALYMLPEHV
jgi:predicted dehydrogenase